MRISKFFSFIFAVLGTILAVAAVGLSFCSPNTAPVLLRQPEEAAMQAETMMAAICEGDFAKAGTLLYGNPDLGVDRQASDEVGVLIWNAFLESLSYEFTGEYYATDSGVARDVTITSLDISSVTGSLKERSQTLLSQRVAEAEDVSQIYDESGEYRESFVMDVLNDAVVQALSEDAVYVEQELTLNLTYQEGQWWVLPDEALMSAISGGIAG